MGYTCWATDCGAEIPGGQEVWLDRSGAVADWAGRPADPAPFHPACRRGGLGAPESGAARPAPRDLPAPAARPLGLNLEPGGPPAPGGAAPLSKMRKDQLRLF